MQTEMRTELRAGCGQALDKLPGKRRKVGFSGSLKNGVSRVTPAWKCDGWLQSGLNFTKFQESASRAVLGGSRYPLSFKNGVFLWNFHRGFASKHPPPRWAHPPWEAEGTHSPWELEENTQFL